MRTAFTDLVGCTHATAYTAEELDAQLTCSLMNKYDIPELPPGSADEPLRSPLVAYH